MKCPVCKGKGHLPEPRSTQRDRTKDKQGMAKVLRANGYSIRQIAEFLDWKSPRSVSVALSK